MRIAAFFLSELREPTLKISWVKPGREKVTSLPDDLSLGPLVGLLDDEMVDVDGGEHHQTEGDHMDGCPHQAVHRSRPHHVLRVDSARVSLPVEIWSVEHLHQNLPTTPTTFNSADIPDHSDLVEHYKN